MLRLAQTLHLSLALMDYRDPMDACGARPKGYTAEEAEFLAVILAGTSQNKQHTKLAIDAFESNPDFD